MVTVDPWVAAAFQADELSAQERADHERQNSRESLTAEYQQWQAQEGLKIGSADEHLFDEALTSAQREWLWNFCERWDRATWAEQVLGVSA